MPSNTIYILSPEVDPRHERAHELVRSGAASEARIETTDGHVLFRAWDHGSEVEYCWQTSQMANPAYWPRRSDEPCDECAGTRWPKEAHEPACSLAN